MAPEYTVDAMKRYLAEPPESVKREQQEKQKQIVRAFRESDFEDLMKRTEPKVRNGQRNKKPALVREELKKVFNSKKKPWK